MFFPRTWSANECFRHVNGLQMSSALSVFSPRIHKSWSEHEFDKLRFSAVQFGRWSHGHGHGHGHSHGHGQVRDSFSLSSSLKNGDTTIYCSITRFKIQIKNQERYVTG
jgi:hypothetical protein